MNRLSKVRRVQGTSKSWLRRPGLRSSLVALLRILAVTASAGFSTPLLADPDGVPICTAPYNQRTPRIISDGAGGAIIVWHDFRDGGDLDPLSHSNKGDIYALRFLSAGVVDSAWPVGGRRVSNDAYLELNPQLVTDGAGGALIVWETIAAGNLRKPVARHIFASGVPDPDSCLGLGGCAVSALSNGYLSSIDPVIAPDAAGGAFVAWSENADLQARRLLPNGQGATGGPVCTAAGGQTLPAIVSDGAGGAIVAWYDFRSGSSGDIYAHHILSGGTTDPTWTADGVAVCTTSFVGDVTPLVGVSDGAGGVYVAWHDYRNFSSTSPIRTFVQHVTSTGVVDPAWPDTGLAVSAADGIQSYPDIVSDGAGGAIVAWAGRPGADLDIYAQHFFPNGTTDPAWPANGVAVCDASGNQEKSKVVPDGAGGAIISWSDPRSGDHDVYSQHILSTGAIHGAWPANGRAVCVAPNDQNLTGGVSDGSGGAIVTWEDFRNDSPTAIYTNRDIFAARVPSFPPDMTISDAEWIEGNGGSSQLVLTIKLSWAHTGATMNYATRDSTATDADNDYEPTSGTLTFLTGDTLETIVVTVNGDLASESDETFVIELSNISGLAVADTQVVVTIQDEDAGRLVCRDLYVADGAVHAMVEAAGKLYIGGSFTRIGPATGGAVAVDASSGAPLGPPLVAGTVNAVAPDGTGGWYVGGSFTHVGGVPRSNLAHLEADQTVSAWNPGANNQVTALGVSGGTVYVGGFFTAAGGAARNRIAALDGTTGAATAWNPNASYVVHALAVSGGTVYAGGDFATIGGQARSRIAALDATSGLATSWNPTGANDFVQAVAVSGNTVYVGGGFSTIGGQSRNRIAALDAATGNATSWNPAPPSGEVYALALSGSTVYAGGDFSEMGGESRNYVAALDSATGFATTWNPDANDPVNALAVSGGTVYAGGIFTHVGGEDREKLVALDAATGLATAWSPSPNELVRSVAVSGGTVYAGGDFTSLGGVSRNFLAALDLSSGLLTPWDPSPTGPVFALAASGGTIYAGGEFSGIVGGPSRSRIMALDATSGLPTTWNPNANSTVWALEVSGGTVYAGGTFTNIGLQPRNRIAALDIGSGLATAWDPNADNSVLDLEESGGTVYASGGFTSIGGAPRNHIAALDGAGLATSWDPNAATGFGVWDLAVDGGTVYAAGHFTNIGGQPRNRIAALDAGTGFATGWNPNASGPVSALAVSGGTVYAGGDFTSIGGDARGYLAELNTGTGLATAWNPNANYVVNALAVSGPRIYAGGNFTRVDGFPQSFITCLIRQELVDAPHSEAIGELAFEISPNPSRGVTLFHYALAQESHVRIRVYDVQGRLLAQLVDELRPAGRHQTSWGGTPSSRSLAAGLYLIQFESGERRITRRLVLLQ